MNSTRFRSEPTKMTRNPGYLLAKKWRLSKIDICQKLYKQLSMNSCQFESSLSKSNRILRHTDGLEVIRSNFLIEMCIRCEKLSQDACRKVTYVKKNDICQKFCKLSENDSPINWLNFRIEYTFLSRNSSCQIVFRVTVSQFFLILIRTVKIEQNTCLQRNDSTGETLSSFNVLEFCLGLIVTGSSLCFLYFNVLLQ